jgi:hypothetical protein
LAEIQFSPEQRAWLGIQQHESVRVLSSSTRTILLEREGGGTEGAFPWDRDLVMTADVRAFALADVLYLLHESKKSGFLFFENRQHAKSVYLHRGEVVFATSNQTVDRLGECLLRLGTIKTEQYKEALRSYSPPGKFGKVLVERGFLTPRALWNGVKAQVEEIVRSLFSYGAGIVYFWEGEVRPDNVVRLSLPTRRLIAEGLRRRDELLRFLARLEDPRCSIETVRDAEVELTGSERAVFESLEGDGNFAGVCRKAELDPLSAARTIQLLRLLGAVRIAAAESPAGEPQTADVRQSDDDAVRECVETHMKLLAELAAPIVAVEGGKGVRERLTQVVEEAAARYPEMLSGLAVGAHGSIDPQELITRALRFPREREREVRLALGELVSYLEFELLNNPRLEDPEQFLEAVESLRSRL